MSGTRWTIKGTAGLWILGTALFLASSWATSVQGDEAQRIAAVVNEEVISGYDLKARVSLVLASSRLEDRSETRQRLAPQVLRALIDEKLQLQEAKKIGVQVSREDISGVLDNMARQNKIPPEKFAEVLAGQGLDKSVLEQQVEAQMAWNRVVKRKLASKIVIGDDEISAMMERLAANEGKPEQHVAEIFLPIENPSQEREATATAERVVEQLRAGASFSALARSFSQSATATNGGDLGWLPIGQLPPELETHLAAMQPGQATPPVRTQSGYYLLALLERRAAAAFGTENVSMALQQVVLPLPEGATADQVKAQEAKAAAYTQNARSCTDMEQLGRNSGSPLSGNLGKIKLSTLAAELRAVVSALPVNQVSRPVRSPAGILVLMVCERDNGTDAEARRERIRDMILQQRLEISARSYLRDIRRAAFVETRL